MFLFRASSATCIALSVVSVVCAQDFSQIDAQNRDAIVFVKSIKQRKDGTGTAITTTGTGFVVRKDGYVLTNSHVVPDEDSDYIVQVSGSDRSRFNFAYPLSLVARDSSLDLALLMFPDVGRVWTTVVIGDDSKVNKSDTLFVLGFPGDQDLSSASGLFSAIATEKGRWQTTIPINYGNSGSPIFYKDGKVVAVAVGGRDDLNSVTFVIPIDYAGSILTMIEHAVVGRPTTTSISQALTFYDAVDSDQSKNVSQNLCVAAGFAIDPGTIAVRETTKNGNGTVLHGVSVVRDKPNCIQVDAFIKGGGTQRLGPYINHLGRGWLGEEIKVNATSASALPAQ